MNLISMTIVGTASQDLYKRARRLKGLVRSAIGDIAHEGEEFIKKNYLEGQALHKITGELHGSVQAFYAGDKGSWFIKKGVRVRGNLNYVAKWIGTSKEFMRPGFDRFLASKDIAAQVAAKVDKSL